MILDLYKDVLTSLNCSVDSEGMISYLVGGTESMPLTINNRRLVLPTPAILANPDWERVIAFHPLAESILRGESPVFRKIKLLATLRLTEVIACLTTELMEIAVDIDCHKRLSPDQNEYLSLIPGVSEKSKTLNDLERLLDGVSPDGEHKLISMYLKRGGKVGDKAFQRVAVVDFPIFKDFEDEGKRVFGTTLSSIKNKKAIQTLFEYVVPNSGIVNHYSYGSNSMIAPYFHALMSAYVKVAKQLNKVTRRFKKHLDNPQHLLIDLSFEKHLDDLSSFSELIPSLQGNEGEIAEPAQAAGSAVALTGSKPTRTMGALEALARDNAEQVALTTQPPKPQNLPWEPQPQPQQHVAVAVPAPVANSTGGLDWNSVINKVPSIAAAAGVPFNPFFPQHQQQIQPVPFAQQPPQPYQPVMFAQQQQNPYQPQQIPQQAFVQQQQNPYMPQYQQQPQVTRGGYVVQPRQQAPNGMVFQGGI